MSDRCVFLPHISDDDAPPESWADVVIAEGATREAIQAAARAFAGLPGPRKVVVSSRTDPRFIEFVRELDDEYAMAEGSDGWTYSVRESNDGRTG